MPAGLFKFNVAVHRIHKGFLRNIYLTKGGGSIFKYGVYFKTLSKCRDSTNDPRDTHLQNKVGAHLKYYDVVISDFNFLIIIV